MVGFVSSSEQDDFVDAGAGLVEAPLRYRNDLWQPPQARTINTHASGLAVHWVDGLPQDAGTSSHRAWQLAFKRVLDIILASMALVALGPLFVLVALATKLSSRGPVFFAQQREGLNGGLFWAYKFRTMRVDAGDPTGVAQTVRNDPRVTSVGRFLRRTSIDELPQLFNVLKGDMSLVGPRPHVPGMLAAGVPYSSLVRYYPSRHVMRPGITGWAQANGLRGVTTDAKSATARVDHDIAYIQNFSLLLDFRILLKTVVREFVTGSGH
jgi:exopolysaccharide biosynthesis polyprenyl glycosylphosphotransferase